MSVSRMDARAAAVAAALMSSALVLGLASTASPAAAASVTCAATDAIAADGAYDSVRSLVLSGDDQVAAYATRRTAATTQVWTFAAATSTSTALPAASGSEPFAVSPDGALVALVEWDGYAASFSIATVADGTVTAVPPLTLDPAFSVPLGVDWSDGGSILMLVADQQSGPYDLLRVDVGTGLADHVLTDAPHLAAQLSPDASTLLALEDLGDSVEGSLIDTVSGARTSLPAEVVGDRVGGFPGGIVGSLNQPKVGSEGATVWFASDDDLDGSNADGNVEIWAYDVAGETTTPVTDTTSVEHGKLIPAGDGVAFVRVSGARQLVVLADGGEHEIATTSGGTLFLDAASAHGAVVLLHENATNGGYRLVDHEVPSTQWIPGRMAPRVRVAGDSARVLSSTADLDGSNPDRSSEVWVGPELDVPLTDALALPSGDATIDAAGEQVALVSAADLTGDNPDGNREVFLVPTGGGDPEQLTDTLVADSRDTTISSDGSTVTFVSTADLGGQNPTGEPVLYQWRNGQPIATVAGPDEVTTAHVRNISVSEDGRWVAFQAPGHGLGGELPYLWDRATDELVSLDELATASFQNLNVAMTEDGTVAWKTPTGFAVLSVGEDQPRLITATVRSNVQGITDDGRYATAGFPLSAAPPQRVDLRSGSVVDLLFPSAPTQLVVGATGSSFTDLSVTGVTTYRCPAFTDVPLDHAFSDEIDSMTDQGVIRGYPDQTFRPSATVTRQAMAAFLYRLADADEPTPTTAPFADVSTTHPFATEVAWAADQDITTGYHDNTFRPSAVVTRQAAIAFLHRLVDPADAAPAAATFDDVSTNHPFFAEIEWAATEQIASGYPDGSFRPSATVTRQAAAAFLHRTQPLL